MKSTGFQGLYVPLVTPLDGDGTVDVDSLEGFASFLAKQVGVEGLVSCARIGEGPVLKRKEKRIVFETVGRVARSAGVQHIATIAPQSTDDAIELVRELESLPVDAVMVFPPLLFAWGKVEGELKYRFFRDLTGSTTLPIVLFQVPIGSYWYDAETVCRIATLEHVVAYKEASFNINLFSETMRQLQRQGSPLQVLTGNDRFVAQSYMLGAQGALIGVANVATERWGRLDVLGRRRAYSEAMALQEELADLKELIFSEPIVEAVARIKTILQHEGLIATAEVRRPQTGIIAAERERLLSSYAALCQTTTQTATEAAATHATA